MEVKHLCLMMLAVVAFGAVSAQSDDEPIPVENDNQFPPDNQAAADDDGGTIQGSGDGDGTLQEPEEPLSTTTESLQVPVEEIQPTNELLAEVVKSTNDETLCPDICTCFFEDGDFVTDCSGRELTEFPSGLNLETTKLKIQNNKLTEIPKQISALQNLKFLNASTNSITDLASGSISELHELVILDLSNNRLIEYPNDLKNSFGLTKLEEIHLGGNDMRTPLGSHTFVMLPALRKITVPSGVYEEQLENTLCKSLEKSLKTICVETCTQELVCPNGPDEIYENEMLDVKIPGVIYSDNNNDEEDLDPTLNSPNDNDSDTEIKSEDNEMPLISTNDTKEVADTNTKSANEFSLHTEVINEPENSLENVAKTTNEESAKIEAPVGISRFNSFVEAPKEESPKIESGTVSRVDGPNDDTDKNNADYKLGAKTSESTGGGVDKSVIGLVVAGMVVIVAGIVIKKNWSSIRKKFSSNSRTPIDRSAGNANGTAPEEIPLQDKSPV